MHSSFSTYQDHTDSLTLCAPQISSLTSEKSRLDYIIFNILMYIAVKRYSRIYFIPELLLCVKRDSKIQFLTWNSSLFWAWKWSVWYVNINTDFLYVLHVMTIYSNYILWMKNILFYTHIIKNWHKQIIMNWYYDRFIISHTISEFDFDTWIQVSFKLDVQ